MKENHNNVCDLDLDEHNEIESALIDASVGLLLCVWEDEFLLFINYLSTRKFNIFKRLKTIFARK